MPTEHLVSNFRTLLLSVNTMRPKREGRFITRTLITSPPSQEVFKIDPADYPIEDYEGVTLGKAKDKKGNKAQSVEKVEPEENDEEEEDEEKAADAKN